MSADETVLETIENEIRTDFNLLHLFKKKNRLINLESTLYSGDGSEIYSFHRLENEYSFGYALFKLYCFYDYTVDEIYQLIRNISFKYHKSDLNRLSYSDFINYTKEKRFEYRKTVYKKSGDEYQKKIQNKKSAESDYIDCLVEDFNSTNMILETLNSDMKYICNDEDVSSEKRAEYIRKCVKITNSLSDKRDNLIKKIRAESL